ncbi:MAG: hypothetical protein J6D29_04780 [Solobacterium sp.]|nr:hypothetical protein [Solobacterium sp.]
MSKMIFQLNREGVAELMKSAEMQEVINEYANNVVSRAGEGYDSQMYIGGTRCKAVVKAVSKQAIKDNLNNNTLLKALR